MPLLKKRSYQRHSEPKLFQCTGYGDCNMVFTRSEHLARHARKHTGEKPFKCAVPGCERTFSRFDNMIQHTSTHSKHHDRKRGPNKKPTTTASTKKAAITTSQRQGNNNPLIIAPNRSRHGSSPSPLLLAPLTSPMNPPTSPLPHIFLPVSPAFEPKSPRSMDYFMHPTFLPSPKDLGLNLPASPLSSVDMPWSPPPLSPPTRKLSNVELDLPIHDLSMSHGVGAYGVHVSGDEFEALQAISQLSSSTIHPCVPTSLSTCSTQVNSFRQHLELAQESYSRLSPRS